MSNPHQARAPSTLVSRARTRSIAVRTPVAAVADAAASRKASLATRPPPWVHGPTRRLTSPGSNEMPRNSTITTAPKMAGTIVIANGAVPGINPM